MKQSVARSCRMSEGRTMITFCRLGGRRQEQQQQQQQQQQSMITLVSST